LAQVRLLDFGFYSYYALHLSNKSVMVRLILLCALIAPSMGLRIGGETIEKKLDPLKMMDMTKQWAEAKVNKFKLKVEGKEGAFTTEKEAYFADGATSNKMCINGHIAPSVFMLGFQKAGTSSLFKDLARRFTHLEAATPLPGQEEEWQSKEVDFFSDPNRYKKGKQFYLSHFPQCTARTPSTRTLDATINNLWGGEDSASKIKQTYGDRAKDIKFLLIVRDPALRMASAYHHFEAEGIGKPWRKFDDYVKRTIGSATAWLARNRTGEEPKPNLYYMSLYGDVLAPWMKVFDPSQFTVITLRQYQQRTKETMHLLETKLDSKMDGCKDSNGQPCDDILQANFRYHDPMKKETKEILDKFFEESGKNQEFEDVVRKHHMGLEDDVEEKRFAAKKNLWSDEIVAPKNARLVDEEYKNPMGKWEGRKYNKNLNR